MEKKHGQKKVNTNLVISELHRAFKMFNENLFNGALPEPAILIQSRGNKKLTLGWCSVQKIWKNEVTEEEKYEINIVAEALNRGIYPVMTTLLHEMIHLHNLVNNIKDTSRGNTYHNMKFKKTAEAHGLLVEHADRIGWSVSKLQGLTMDLIDEHKFDEAVFSLGRRDLNFEGAGKPRKKAKTSSRKYICPCCGTSIRASKDVNILCGDCTNIEEGKIVQMYKEQTEDDFGDNDEMKTFVCLDCGCVHELPEGQLVCPECGGKLQEMEAESEDEEPVEPIEEPAEPIEEPIAHAPAVGLSDFVSKYVKFKKAPAEIVEVDKTLIDGDGNEVEVKQGVFKAVKIEWTGERVAEILEAVRNEAEAFGLELPSAIPFEISEKLNSQYAKYVEGKKIVLSKAYLEEASDEDIIDTIKHQFLHHFQYEVHGLKMNHKKEFKALCEQFGLSTKVPVKNHRAMK